MTTAELFNDTALDTEAEKPTPLAAAPDKASPQAAVQLVTPEYAAQLLAANTRNRRLRIKLVESYARDMAAGRWTENFEPVQVAEDARKRRLDEHVRKIVDAAPPLTAAQRDRLAVLLRREK